MHALKSSLAAVLVALFVSVPVGAQSIHLIDGRRFLLIDDQLVDADLVQVATAGAQPPGGGSPAAARPVIPGQNAAPADTDYPFQVVSPAQAARLSFPGWDFGVVPVAFSADVSADRRARFFRACETWGQRAPIKCVERTSQSGYLRVGVSDDGAGASSCYAFVGQTTRLSEQFINLGSACWADKTLIHELGHSLGFWHEHQRPDRDRYIAVDLSNVPDDKRANYAIVDLRDPLGPYDFGSIMHYGNRAFAADLAKPVMIPQAGYQSFAASMGTATVPSTLDHDTLTRLYRVAMRPRDLTAPYGSPQFQFGRGDFLDAMERLHAFYFSRMGLNRSSGLSIGGRPDFQGIATWIFDVYLAARSRGYTNEQSFAMVVADITQTEEWRQKHPGETPSERPAFTPLVSLNRSEFLGTLQQLDAFYASADGLQRPQGLAIAGGPDFLGIATWLFDVYLNERLSGGSPNVAWTRVENAIRDTDEWRSKHGR